LPGILKDESCKKAVLLLGHGSPVREANEVLREIARFIRASGGYASVQQAFLQFEEPDFQTAVDLIVKGGSKDVIVAPYFLYRGSHIINDLPQLVEEAKKRYPGLNLTLAPTLGFHQKLVDVAIERIEGAEGRDERPLSQRHFPRHPIERESFSIIEKELGGLRFSQRELAVVKRVIHATADFDFKELLRFSPGAARAGIKAVVEGRNIVTDVRMVEAGIMREGLTGRVLCFSSDRDVARAARTGAATRTALSMRKGARFMDGAIAVVGNAPTALRELLRLISEGEARSALVVGVPVGFVGAEEAKHELMRSDSEFITCMSKKGGTPVAVSIVNALIIEAGQIEVRRRA
jgi:precorrin-8X/cobalt-precorrin-8 methylmutase